MKAFLAALLLAVIVLPACKKDRTQPLPGTPIDRNIVINFTSATIPFSQVDSASIIMNKQGTNQPHFRRFDKVPGELNLVMDDNLRGNWSAEFYVYTTEGNNNHLYKREVGFSLPMTADITVSGPDDGPAGLWTKMF